MQARLMKPISCFVLCAFVLLDLSVSSAGARLIDTQSVLAAQQQETTRQQVAAFFDREDVQQLLVQQGIDAVEAQNRVASLSDEELAKVARTMDQLPAGGNGVGAVIGAAVFIFVLLLVTDILGLTHVYPFVTHKR
jgi:Na+-transporting NADH:ubiquinone oxidoreductase subunit NqrC